MAGTLAELLTSLGDQTTALWLTDPHGPSPEQAPRLLDGVVQALMDGNDAALLRAAGLTEQTPDDEAAARLDIALRHLQALSRVVQQQNREAPQDGHAALHAEADDLQRRLATAAAALLARRATELRATVAARVAALAVTVHELRRPLTILGSYAELLSDGTLGPLTAPALSGVQGIASATEVLHRLIEALAEVAQLEDPDDQPVLEALTVGDLIDEAVGEIVAEAQLRGVGIEVTADAGVPLHGDRRRLVMALVNLLGNAVKHAPTASTISIRGDEDEGWLRLSVADRGPGFPAQEAARLFEKYYRSVVERESGIPGTGLGLFIVKTVVERNGGSVAARLRSGGGAEFEMRLPVAAVREWAAPEIDGARAAAQ